MDNRNIEFACVDVERQNRQGFAEVVFCQGKTHEQVVSILEILLRECQGNVLATRVDPILYDYVAERLEGLEYNDLARTMVWRRGPQAEEGRILVISAGTSDVPVAEEAAVTASVMGNRVERLYDVGVAGIHRMLEHMDVIRQARVLVVVAGMDGALPSVIGGLVDTPVIAVPTSVGYGASFGGLAALLTMLNSCAAGVGVVNIDNGFGAGRLASTINRLGGVTI
ncbi:MAG: nickel pincer cofactor biosynthesis protein LarB [Peptococcaceae bacterium]|jgi:NCAIR mutase (PurE)-related protein|nr:nickel pincer cofactor biosynthesis protein LarB [Peptococcaceae bacterium]MDR2737037.1 nickel pincer cofactor biosynthesis protein LarB [Gracilibacteraceae bacterium]